MIALGDQPPLHLMYKDFKDTATLDHGNLVILNTTRMVDYGAKLTLTIVNNNLVFESNEFYKK